MPMYFVAQDMPLWTHNANILSIILYMFNYCTFNDLTICCNVRKFLHSVIGRSHCHFGNARELCDSCFRLCLLCLRVVFYFRNFWSLFFHLAAASITLPLICHHNSVYFSMMEDTDLEIVRHNNINTIVAIITIIPRVHVIHIYGASNGFIILKTSSS